MSKGKDKEENLIRKEEFDSLFVELKKIVISDIIVKNGKEENK